MVMTHKMVAIAVDMMSGDRSVHERYSALSELASRYPDIKFIAITTESSELPCTHSNITKEICQHVIEMDDEPLKVIRSKSKSSIHIGCQKVRDGLADAFVSAGNTGALMAISKMVVKMVDDVERPAIISTFPHARGRFLMLDLGANVACSAQHLVQFASLGQVFAQCLLKKRKPKIGLLNIGHEAFKGNDVVREADQILSSMPCVNYQGFIEGNDLFTSEMDVVVTDGWVGNHVLKSCEGMAGFIKNEFKSSLLHASFWQKILIKMLKPLLKSSFAHVDPKCYNGAILGGLKGVVVKSHGSADAEAFAYAIETAINAASIKVNASVHAIFEGKDAVTS